MQDPKGKDDRKSKTFLESKNFKDSIIEPEIEVEEESYFKNDPKQDNENTETTTKPHKIKNPGLYDTYFRPRVFLRYFLTHILFFFILGPFLAIFTPILGYNELKNQGFLGFTKTFLNQTIQYLLVISLIILLYVDPNPELHFMEVYSMLFQIFFRIIIISMKYAFASDNYLEAMKTRRIKSDEFIMETILGHWALQTEDIIHHELQTAILRTDIESSLFFFEFIYKDSELEKKFHKSNTIGKIEIKSVLEELNTDNTAKEKKYNDLSFNKIQVIDSAKNKNSCKNSLANSKSTGTEPRRYSLSEKIFPKKKRSNSAADIKEVKKGVVSENLKRMIETFSSFLSKKKLEDNKLFGYNLLFDIIIKSKKMRYHSLFSVTIVLSAIRAFIPIFYRIYLGEPAWTSKPYMAIIPLIINFIFFWFNLSIIIVSLLDNCSRGFHVKQISSLLVSKKKTMNCREKQIYPTINIFDPVSLKTWENMRRVTLEYGKKFIVRNNVNLTIIMLIYLVIISILVLQALKVLKAYSDPLLLIIFSFESAIFAAIFLSIFVGGCFINEQYRVNKNLLKKAKIIISDFLRLSNFYVGEHAIIPDNRIYREGILLLRKELGDVDFESKLRDRCKNLIAIIDDNMEDLEYEFENEPFTVMGIAPSYSLLKTIIFGLGSIVFAVIQRNFGV